MLEECDALLVGIQSTIENDELGDRYAADILLQASTTAYEFYILAGDLSGKRHLHRLHAVTSAEVVHIKLAGAKPHFDFEISRSKVRHILLKLQIQHADVHVIRLRFVKHFLSISANFS